MEDNFNVLFVNYNLQEFIHIAICSLREFHPTCKIFVFDNSNNGTKFENIYDDVNITIFDNTKGQIIPFANSLSNAGSKKHAICVQKCFDLINDNFILADTDIVVKSKITDFIDDNYIACGSWYNYTQLIDNVFDTKYYKNDRFNCTMLYINVKMCKENNINFYDENRIGLIWDTSASFYSDIKNKFPIKYVKTTKYISHFRGGSRYVQRNKDLTYFYDWLNKYNKYLKKYNEITT